MDPILGGAVVGTVGNLIGQGANMFASRRANHRMVQFWKMQNEYNHPAAQMQRLRDAGLNPNLIYGDSVSGATGRADSIGRPDKPEFSNPLGDIGMYQDLRLRRAQTNNVEAQASVNLVKAVAESVKASNETLKGVGIRLDNQVKESIARNSADMQALLVEKLQKQIIGQEIDNMVKNQSAADLIKKRMFEAAAVLQNIEESKERVKYLQSGTALRELEAQLKKDGLENSPYWARYIYRRMEEWSEKMPGWIHGDW